MVSFDGAEAELHGGSHLDGIVSRNAVTIASKNQPDDVYKSQQWHDILGMCSVDYT